MAEHAGTTPALDLDLRGRPCPLPMLELSRRIGDVDVGAVVRAVTDNAGSLADLPAWARATGHEMVDACRDGDSFVFLVRRGR